MTKMMSKTTKLPQRRAITSSISRKGHLCQLGELSFCECGCGQEIIIRPYHKYYGIPHFIWGHNSYKPLRICSIDGCNEKHRAKGLCNKHWKKQWCIDNKKKIAKQKKQYHLDNKEHLAKRHKQWRKTPIGKTSRKVSYHNRRILKKGLTLAIMQQIYEDNIAKYGVLTCYLCGKPIVNNDDSLDHSTPITRGGSNEYENLGVAHRSCNCKKSTKTLEEWFDNCGTVELDDVEE